MSNRIKLRAEKDARVEKPKPKCPGCGCKRGRLREYSDAWLFVCKRCKFPLRFLKEPA